MKKIAVIAAATIALGFSASACTPEQECLAKGVVCTIVGSPTEEVDEKTFDAPQAPGPDVKCDEGFSLNEFGDCKRTEAPQAPLDHENDPAQP